MRIFPQSILRQNPCTNKRQGDKRGMGRSSSYPAVDGSSCLHQLLHTGLQLPALVLQLFTLLFWQCQAAPVPQQCVVGQDSTVQRGMAWGGSDDGPHQSSTKRGGCELLMELWVSLLTEGELDQVAFKGAFHSKDTMHISWQGCL